MLTMTNRHLLAPYLQNYFLIRMRAQLNSSEHTISSYRDTFRLLLNFAESKLRTSPDRLYVQNIDDDLVGNFLNHLEIERGNAISTRNNRLAAIHSFFKYVANREPDILFHCQQILNLPTKKADSKLIEYLTENEVKAVLGSVGRSSWYQRRDSLLLRFVIETGVRVSELVSIRIQDISFSRNTSVSVKGKGRKFRNIPVYEETSSSLSNWILINKKTETDYLFSTRKRQKLSRDSIERITKKYSILAQNNCSSLAMKKVSPHTLRHTFAMRMLENGVGLPLISLWMGHEDPKTTMIYIHASKKMKEQALELTKRIVVPDDKPEDDIDDKDKLRKFLEEI